MRAAIHPGEILKDELEFLGIKPTVLSEILGVPRNRISQIVNEKRNITPDTAMRLGKWFGTGARFWINLQTNYELRLIEQKIGAELDKIPTRPQDSPHAHTAPK